MKIVIVDYGMGNIRSIVSTLNYLNVHDIKVSDSLETFKSADRIILPGVGNFGKAISQIRSKNLDDHLQTVVMDKKKPLLGICLGMQLLGLSSSEHGYNKGLSFVNGVVTKFDNSKVKVPHVGFNQIKVNINSKLFEGITDGADFYFTHSYRMHSEDDINKSLCHYQDDFIAGFEVDNICGVQFHPELSQFNGLRLIKNFINNF
jgi:imidazole glycerol-phosphate synthase subunit HisH